MEQDPRRPVTADKAWLETLTQIRREGLPVEPQLSKGSDGNPTFEIRAHAMTWDMRWPIVTTKPNTSWIYMCAEPMWVLAGSSKLHWSAEIARIQAPYSDNGVHLNGAYGPHFSFQKRFVANRLNHDRNTRQAIMSLWRRNPPHVFKDIACTVALQFLIREGSIHSIVYMRSSDAGKGLPYDMITFACMTAEIASMLNEPVELGTCTIVAGSRHLYLGDFDKLNPPELGLRTRLYEPWAMWKWPAIKETMLRLAKLVNYDDTQSSVQIEARDQLLEASGATRS